MSRPPRPAPPPAEEEDEFDEEMDEEEMDEGVDMFASLLATEDGETVAELVKRQADATEKIALNLEMQNKILVKILTALTKPAPATDAA